MEALVEQLEELRVENERLREHIARTQPRPPPPLPNTGNTVEMVYSLLSMVGSSDKEKVSRTLLSMSTCRESCVAMRKAGCISLLVSLIHPDPGEATVSRVARQRAATALHNLVSAYPDELWRIRETRVLRLLEQLRAHCEWVHEKRASEGSPPYHPGPTMSQLMKLSYDEDYRHAISTLGGLQAITELLVLDVETASESYRRTDTQQYSVLLRRYCCMSITNLTFGEPSNKLLVCQSRPALLALVSLLRSSHDDLVQVAASVIRNLSWCADSPSKRALRDAEAVRSLLHATRRQQKESALRAILNALWNISAHSSENKAEICGTPGALSFIVSTLTARQLSVVETGGGILRNISSKIAVEERFRQEVRSAFPALLSHLKSSSLTIVSNSAGTLWNLSAINAADQRRLVELGAVPMLRSLMNSKHKMISTASAAALKNLRGGRWLDEEEEERASDLHEEDAIQVYKTEGTPGAALSASESLHNLDSPAGKKSVQFSELVTPMMFSRCSTPETVSSAEACSPRSDVPSEYSRGASGMTTPCVDLDMEGPSGAATPEKSQHQPRPASEQEMLSTASVLGYTTAPLREDDRSEVERPINYATPAGGLVSHVETFEFAYSETDSERPVVYGSHQLERQSVGSCELDQEKPVTYNTEVDRCISPSSAFSALSSVSHATANTDLSSGADTHGPRRSSTPLVPKPTPPPKPRLGVDAALSQRPSSESDVSTQSHLSRRPASPQTNPLRARALLNFRVFSMQTGFNLSPATAPAPAYSGGSYKRFDESLGGEDEEEDSPWNFAVEEDQPSPAEEPLKQELETVSEPPSRDRNSNAPQSAESEQSLAATSEGDAEVVSLEPTEERRGSGSSGEDPSAEELAMLQRCIELGGSTAARDADLKNNPEPERRVEAASVTSRHDSTASSKSESDIETTSQDLAVLHQCIQLGMSPERPHKKAGFIHPRMNKAFLKLQLSKKGKLKPSPSPQRPSSPASMGKPSDTKPPSEAKTTSPSRKSGIFSRERRHSSAKKGVVMTTV